MICPNAGHVTNIAKGRGGSLTATLSTEPTCIPTSSLYAEQSERPVGILVIEE